MSAGTLDVKSKMTLELERTWWRYPAAKDTAIIETFSETPARYYQRLGKLLDDPAALAHDPMLVRRLRRLRDARREARRSHRVR